MDVDRSAGVSAGSEAELLATNTPTVFDPAPPARSPSEAGVRPTVSIKGDGHPLVVYTRGSEPSLARPDIVRQKRPGLFHRPWILQGSRDSKRKRRGRTQSTPSQVRPSGRVKPIVALAPRPRGPLAFLRITALYDRLMSQLRRSRRRRLGQGPGLRRAGASIEGENKRQDRPGHTPPPVHWALRTPESQGQRTQDDGHRTTPTHWTLQPPEAMPGFVSRSVKAKNGRNARERHERGRPVQEWERGRDKHLASSRRRPIDHRLAEYRRMEHSLRTCRAQPARRNKSRRPGRAG